MSVYDAMEEHLTGVFPALIDMQARGPSWVRDYAREIEKRLNSFVAAVRIEEHRREAGKEGAM